jgi:hypothetical protein
MPRSRRCCRARKGPSPEPPLAPAGGTEGCSRGPIQPSSAHATRVRGLPRARARWWCWRPPQRSSHAKFRKLARMFARCCGPSRRARLASCAAANSFMRLSSPRPLRVRMSAWERRSCGEARRRIRPRRSSPSSRRTRRARSMPSRSATSACDRPALASITTSTAYYAGRMSRLASERTKSWNTCSRRTMPLEHAKIERLPAPAHALARSGRTLAVAAARTVGALSLGHGGVSLFGVETFVALGNEMVTLRPEREAMSKATAGQGTAAQRLANPGY